MPISIDPETTLVLMTSGSYSGFGVGGLYLVPTKELDQVNRDIAELENQIVLLDADIAALPLHETAKYCKLRQEYEDLLTTCRRDFQEWVWEHCESVEYREHWNG